VNNDAMQTVTRLAFPVATRRAGVGTDAERTLRRLLDAAASEDRRLEFDIFHS
jgi:hypothetical protein